MVFLVPSFWIEVDLVWFSLGIWRSEGVVSIRSSRITLPVDMAITSLTLL